MNSGVGRLPRAKQILGIALAAVILTIIFVPFQRVAAFSVDIDFPNAADGSVSQSATGEAFEITIDVAVGELISVDTITLVLDIDEGGAARVATFDTDGDFVSGSNSLVKDNKLTVSTFSNSGYGYGYGSGISSGTTFTTPPYSITSLYGFIGGNTLGYQNEAGGTNLVTGLGGPGTLTLSGTLRTATLAEGDHTLDVLIDTGAGGNDEDQLTAPTFTFTVEEDDSVVVVDLEVPAGSIFVEVDTTDSDGNPVNVELNLGAATAVTGDVIVVVQSVDAFIAANTEAELEAQGFGLSGSQLTFVTDDADTTFIAVGFILDIDISALGLPDGTEVTLSMTYDDTGLSNAEENDVRLMHQLDTLDEWEALTNDDEDINDGDEVDTDANIVYGTTDDFSLFAPAVEVQDDDDDDAPSGGGGGGGGSRTVIITWPTTTTLPAEHFINFPLDRIQVASSAFVNAGGVSIDSAVVNQQVSIAGEFTNQQPSAQDYAFIVQVLDEEGFVTDIAWQQGTLEGGSTADVSTLWTPETDGTFTVQIFVWNEISISPEPLSEVTVRNIAVTG